MADPFTAIVAIGKTVFTWLGTKGVAQAIARFVIMQAALTVVSRLLSPKPESLRQQAAGLKVMIRSTVEPRHIVYGTTLKSGVLTYANVTGAGNKHLWHVVSLTGHEVEDIQDVWLNGNIIPDADIDDEPNIQPTALINVTSGTTRFKNFVGIQRMLGAPGQVYSSWLGNNDGNWDSTKVGNDIAYLVTCFTHTRPEAEGDPDPWSTGVPQNIRAIVKGKKCYDPRLDSSAEGSGTHRTYDSTTWEWTDNPALCLRDYMTDEKLGLGEAHATIDDTSVSVAASICDETVSVPGGSQTRYLCNGMLSTGTSPSTNIENLLSSMMGTLVYVRGEFRIFAGAYDAPCITLTKDDLAGALSIQASAPRRERFNTVQMTYVSPSNQYEVMESQPVTNATYQTNDGDEEIVRYMDLPLTQNEFAAQRMATILVEQSRLQRTVLFPAKLTAYPVTIHDTVNLEFEEFGWSSDAQNMFLYSEDFSQTWTLSGCSVEVYEYLAPDGTYQANKVTGDGATSNQSIIQALENPFDDELFTIAVHAKKGNHDDVTVRLRSADDANEAYVTWDFDDNGVSFNTSSASGFKDLHYGVEPIGGGWHRLWIEARVDGWAGQNVEGCYYVGFGSATSNHTFFWGASGEDKRLGHYWPTTSAAFVGAKQVFRVKGSEFDGAQGLVTLKLQEDNSTAWGEPNATDYNDPGTPPDVDPPTATPEAPTNGSIQEFPEFIRLTWDNPPPGTFERIQIKYWTSDASGSAVVIGEVTGTSFDYYPDSTATLYYYLRAVNSNNQFSTYHPTLAGGITSTQTTSVIVTPGGAQMTAVIGPPTVVVPTALSVSITPPNFTESVGNKAQTTVNSLTANVTGGTEPYTYVWSRQSGDTQVDATSSTDPTTTIDSNGRNRERTAVMKVTVTDDNSDIATDTVNVTILHGVPR